MGSQETEWGAGFFVTNLLRIAAAVSFTCSKVLIRVGRLTPNSQGQTTPHIFRSQIPPWMNQFFPRWQMLHRQVAFQIPRLACHCPLQIPLCLWDYFSLGYHPWRQGCLQDPKWHGSGRMCPVYPGHFVPPLTAIPGLQLLLLLQIYAQLASHLPHPVRGLLDRTQSQL